ncbi:hypothetical protein KLP28_04300 [Nocardioidaceae bacterium]|nr:hypothetical protein KLP28_04300 [Nocardioidaceae bacterium]
MPELPEVEAARSVVEQHALQREISDVDDHDTYECRPHDPGEIKDALVGLHVVAANRVGKQIFLATAEPDGTPGATLGIHLGMSGRILVSGPDGSDGVEGGDYLGSDGQAHRARKEEWYRFSLDFVDGGRLRLFDKRRLGRVVLDPDLEALGPDAERVGRDDFRALLAASSTAVKTRLMDQGALAGIGNLLADEILWQCALDPHRPAEDLTEDEADAVRRAMRKAIRDAHAAGGVHHGEIIPHRQAGAACPRCGAEMVKGTVGSRTTWWCSAEQA